MPYGRRSFRKRRRNRRRIRRYVRNRSSKRQAYQLARMSKRVSSLDYRLRTMGNTFTYYNEYSKAIPNVQGGLGLYGYTVVRLHPQTTGTDKWEPCLDQPTQAQLSKDDWTLRKTLSKFRISIGSEESNPIRFTAFIVQVRRNYRDMTYYNLGDDLKDAYVPQIPGSNDPNDINFNPWNTFDSGQVFLNRKIFKVLWKREFTLGQVTSGSAGHHVNNIRDTERNFTFRLGYGKYGTKLGRSQPTVEDALDHSQKTVNRNCWTFLLIISNDSTLDLSSGRLQMTNLHYLRTR